MEEYPIIHYLTDQVIDTYAKKVVTDWRDINLRYRSYYRPYKNSIFSPQIFGSLYQDRCNCGQVREKGTPCAICGAEVLREVDSFSRYAKIELPVFYITRLKFPKLYKFILSNFNVEYRLTSGLLDTGRTVSDKEALFNICQFEYYEQTNTIIATDEITDYTICSYEGLQEIILRYKPELLVEYMTHINRKILVIPMRLRPVRKVMTKEGEKLDFHEISTIYQNIIFACESFYKGMEGDLEDPAQIAMLRATLRMYVSKAMSSISNLLRSSKENFARYMQADRLDNSGRCTIIPGPHLRIDEVELPVHLYYEACREEFTRFVQKEYNTSLDHAEILVTRDSNTDEIQRLFSLFVEGDPNDRDTYPGKYVIINRAPTLHEYNLIAMKVHLTKANTMSLPIAVCKAFNADFDGDTMAWYDIPGDIQDIVKSRMSPSTMLFYKNTHEPMFLPTQEVMHGLILATKVRRGAEVKSYGDSIEALEAYRIENKRTFKYQTLIEFNGEETTLARLILSKLFDYDINKYLGGLDKNLTSKMIPFLYENIAHHSDRIDRIRDIQNLALKIVTIAGVTSLSLEELYSDLDEETLSKIRDIVNSELLSTREKDIKTRELYKQFISQSKDRISEDVLRQVSESSRMKDSQLLDIINPRLTTTVKGVLSVGESSLAQGMTPEDYVNLAVENRATQDIKGDNVPGGGYFTRQLVYVASLYSYQEGEDKENSGILLERNRAFGRTTVDGEVVGASKSSEMVRVRSLVTSQMKRAFITPDLISNKITYADKSKIGLSIITSMSQGLTQGMLALKHGGNLFNLNPNSALVAPDNVDQVFLLDQFIVLQCGEKQYRYPKPDNWVSNFEPTGKYEKGAVVGYSYRTFTPSYMLDCFIKLTKARKVRSSKRFAKNQVEISCCFSIDGGVISYQPEKGTVTIGNHTYPYASESMYLYPEGTKIQKYQRICSGIADLDWYLSQLGDFEEGFYLFRAQLRELVPNVVDELIEFTYKLIIRRNKSGQLVNRGVINTIHEINSFFTELAFEDHKKAFNKLTTSGTPLIDDTMGLSFLPSLMQSTVNVLKL